MSSNTTDSDQTGRENFEAKRLELRKKYFGTAGSITKPEASSPLVSAIRKAFPNSDASYLRLIERRYTEAYRVPEAEAIRAVTKGYSSPAAAMNSRIIKRRDYLGFKGERDE